MYKCAFNDENFPSIYGNFFQSNDFYRVLYEIGWNPIKIICGKKDSKASVMAWATKKIPVFSNLFSQFLVYYGPTIDSNVEMGLIDELLMKLIAQVKKCSCISVDIRTPFPYPFGYEYFQKRGFNREIKGGEYSALIDLEKDPNELWQEMRRNTRRCIAKAEKRGVEVKGIDSETELQRFYDIYCKTGDRRNFTPYPYKFFRLLWSQLEHKELVKFFVAVWRGKLIAGILNTFYNKESIPYIMGSLHNYWNLCPNHLLVWHSMNWSKEIRGSSFYKLGYMPKKRSPESKINHYQFKSSFGGNIVEECTFYKKIISPIKYKIYNTLNRTPRWRAFYSRVQSHA